VPSWDEDSPQLRQNLVQVLEGILQVAGRREKPTLATAKSWQALVMQGLDVPDPSDLSAHFAANQDSKTSK